MIYSPHANIIRYTNGTLIKLIATSTGFVSPDYDFAKDTGTYQPPSIRVTATLQGDVKLGAWYLSKDGGAKFDEITSREQGITIGDGYLTIFPDSKLFSSGSIVIKCVGDDEEHYDTITITREVDPEIVYRRAFTDITQTNNKIMLLASDEQLAQFSTSQTLINKVADIELTAQEFRTDVTANYTTKNYVETATTSAKQAAISTSQTYADTVSGTAKAEAISSAKAYTDTAETSAKTYASTQAQNAESNAKGYADSVGTEVDDKARQYADDAESNAVDYAATAALNAEYNAREFMTEQLTYYPTITDMRTAIDQTAESITMSAAETYSTKQDLIAATDGVYTLQAPSEYDSTNDFTEFTAKVYKKGLDVTSEFPASHYWWFVKSEARPGGKYSGQGYKFQLPNSDVGYNGSVVLLFTGSGHRELQIEVPIYAKEAISKKFAELVVASDEIRANVTEQYSTITNETEEKLTDLESRMTIKADGIETMVTNKFTNYSTTDEMNGAIKNVDDKFADYSTTDEMEEAIGVVDDKFANYSTTTEMQTAITQSATGVKSEVMETVNSNYTSTQMQFTLVDQKANGIILQVAKNAEGKTIISTINQTPEEISIQASKISLEGLVTANSNFKILTDGSMETIKAKVGGININGNSIYSDGHDQITSTTPGFVLKSDGSFGFGDDTNYIKFAKDNKNVWKAEANFDKLTISASDSLVIGGSSAATQTDIKGIKAKVETAQSTADLATTAAGQAKTTATAATSTANEAKTAATSATTTANEAKTAATTANSTANEAKTTATSANTTANQANTTASTANTTANEAKTTATTANTTANEAKTTAETASANAEEAKKTATNFLYFDENTGLVVSEVGASVGTDAKPHNVQIKGDGIYFRTKSTVLGSINGDAFTLYKPGSNLKKMMELVQGGLYFYNTRSEDATAKYTENGLEVITGKIADFTISGNTISGSMSQKSTVDGQEVTKTYSLAIRSPKNTGTRALELFGGESTPSFYLTYAGALFTNNATIGGMHVDASSIYSGSHKAYNSSNDGFYLGSSGAFSVGNGTNYIRFYKSGDDWKLDIRANELKFGGVAPATADDVASVRTIANGASSTASSASTTASQAQTTANAASSNASSALTQVNTLKTDVSTANTNASQAKTTATTANTTANEAKTTAATANTNASTALTTANTANTTANQAKTAATDAAKTATNYLYASTSGLYISANGSSPTTGSYMLLSSDGLKICKGANNLATLTGSALSFYVSNKIRTSFGTNTYFYDTNGNTILTINSAGLTCYDSNSNGLSIANGAFNTYATNGDKKYNVFRADGYGVKIRSREGNYVFTSDESGIVNFYTTINGTYGTFSQVLTALSGTFKNGINIANTSGTIYASISSTGVGSFRGVKVSNSKGAETASISAAGAASFASTLSVTGKATFNGGAALWCNNITLSDPGLLCFAGDGITIGWQKKSASSRRFKDVHRNLAKEDVEAFYSVRPVLAEYKEGHFSEDDPWNGVSMPMMIAEDIEEAFPGCTHVDDEGLPRDYDDHVMLSVHQQMILDQNDRINALESEVAELKEMIRRLLDGKTD